MGCASCHPAARYGAHCSKLNALGASSPRLLPWPLQVFVQDAEVQGRYKLVAERLSRPGERVCLPQYTCCS